MSTARVFTIGMALIAVLAETRHASAGEPDPEIVALKRQLRLMQQKLDRLERTTEPRSSVAPAFSLKAEPANRRCNRRHSFESIVAGGCGGQDAEQSANDLYGRRAQLRGDNQSTASRRRWVQLPPQHCRGGPAAVKRRYQRATCPHRRRRQVSRRLELLIGLRFRRLIRRLRGHRCSRRYPVSFLPGGGVSGIENASLSYTGIKPFGGKLAIEGGYMDIPFTLDEATSSNDVLFLERSSAQVIATSIAAGDARSSVGMPVLGKP